MGVVGRGPAKGVIHKWGGEKGSVRQVLQPAAAALIAHEEIELAVGSKSEHAAVVIALRGGIVGARVTGNGNIVGLEGSQSDDVDILRQARAIPDKAIDPVAQER